MRKPALAASLVRYRGYRILRNSDSRGGATDMTYVPMRHGVLYPVTVMDWFSRHRLSQRLSNTRDARFCLEALDEALHRAMPEIFNSDPGSQFLAAAFIGRLEAAPLAPPHDIQAALLSRD